jgi:putative transposase
MRTSVAGKRRSVRLPGYDYSRHANYFVTICADHQRCIFGAVLGSQLTLSAMGEIVREEWLNTARIRPYVLLDEFVIMPNHIHGILCLRDRSGMLPHAPTAFANPLPETLSSIIGNFKAATTRRIRIATGKPLMPVWQRSFFEHVIENNQSYEQIQAYIKLNPSRWKYDRENPDRIVSDIEREDCPIM